MDCYNERKEFFEGIIDGVFYVKKYAFPIKCDCKKENDKEYDSKELLSNEVPIKFTIPSFPLVTDS